jgi:hypothetical protein
MIIPIKNLDDIRKALNALTADQLQQAPITADDDKPFMRINSIDIVEEDQLETDDGVYPRSMFEQKDSDDNEYPVAYPAGTVFFDLQPISAELEEQNSLISEIAQEDNSSENELKPYTPIERVQSLVDNYRSSLTISQQYHKDEIAKVSPLSQARAYQDGALTGLDRLESLLDALTKVLDGSDPYLKGEYPYQKLD